MKILRAGLPYPGGVVGKRRSLGLQGLPVLQMRGRWPQGRIANNQGVEVGEAKEEGEVTAASAAAEASFIT